jgi:D-arabinose 1-dehydrogenase-like Zn-dependent alcohol dehydrogenase
LNSLTDQENAMAKMQAVQVARAGGSLELVERDVPEPARGEVRVRVEACGVCHSDSLTVEGHMPGLTFPRIPGHEIAGVIDALGAGVVGWRAGQRAGVGWFGGHCGHCEPCRRGWLIDCRNLRIPGASYDGGYAEAMVVPADALAAIPDELGAAEAAPLLCARVTTFNALRHSGAMPGDVVAILGVGGSAISACCSRTNSDSAPSRSHAAPTKSRCHALSARTTSSTVRPRTWRRRSTD